MERIKRSWTQEHLAQETGVSVRTIQRIEGGESVNPETIRLLAQALEIDVKSIKSQSLRLNFSSPWSKNLKISTSVILLILLVGGVYSLSLNPWVFEGIVALILLCFVLSVQGYSIKEGSLLVHRTGWSNRFPLSEIQELKIDPNITMGSIRLWGIGGFFSSVGLFRNNILGRYSAYLTDESRALMIRIKGKTIVITPDDPSEMLRSIEVYLDGSLSKEDEE